MREIKLTELMTLYEGTTVIYNVLNDDNYLVSSGYITILDTEDKNIGILADGKKSLLNNFIKIAERQMDDREDICYKFFVIENPYERMWRSLKNVLRDNATNALDGDNYVTRTINIIFNSMKHFEMEYLKK